MDLVSDFQNLCEALFHSVKLTKARYADNYHGKYFYAQSDDLNTWGGMTELPYQSEHVRHGTVLLQS